MKNGVNSKPEYTFDTTHFAKASERKSVMFSFAFFSRLRKSIKRIELESPIFKKGRGKGMLASRSEKSAICAILSRYCDKNLLSNRIDFFARSCFHGVRAKDFHAIGQTHYRRAKSLLHADFIRAATVYHAHFFVFHLDDGFSFFASNAIDFVYIDGEAIFAIRGFYDNAF